MPRANRHFIPGYIWHITHRCHRTEYLLKFLKDRKRYIHWLLEAKRRYGLTVLNFNITSNHIHLLVLDNSDRNTIPKAMQLIAGRTAQEYNSRKDRTGAFWQDRYHATAIESGKHLRQCIVYIDLNMVRAGVVAHPSEWNTSGFNEIQQPRRKNKIIDYEELMDLLGFERFERMRVAHKGWITKAVEESLGPRQPQWTESIAVGSEGFIADTKTRLGIRAKGRRANERNGQYELRESKCSYNAHFDPKKGHIEPENLYIWNELI